MNERIKELAEQAGITTNIDTDYFEKDMNKWVDYFAGVFSQLIIQECIDSAIWVGETNKNPVEPIHTAWAIKKRIESRFNNTA